jgi:O-antigen ligase
VSGDWRARSAHIARRLATFSFAVLIVVSPFRAGFHLVARPTQLVSSYYTDFALSWGEIAVLATLGSWIAALLLAGRGIRIGPRFVAIPVAGLLVIAWLGVPSSIDPPLAAYSALKLTLAVALALYVVNEIDGVERIVLPVAIMIAIQSFVAIGQVATQGSLGLVALQERAIGPSTPGLSVVVALDGTRLLRAYGLTDHPNLLGGVLAFALLLLTSVMGGTRVARLSRTLVFALGTSALFLTFSRSAWLAFGAGLVVAPLMLVPLHDRAALRHWLLAGGVAIVVSVALVLPFAPYLAARVNATGPIPTEVRSIDERIALASEAGTIFLARPALGSGLGTLPVAMERANPDFRFTFQPAHVVLIDAAAETGILGALCYLAIAVGPWLAMVRDRARWTRALVGASATLAAVTIVGLFDYYTWTPSVGRTWAWIVLGLWVVAYRAAQDGAGDA